MDSLGQVTAGFNIDDDRYNPRGLFQALSLGEFEKNTHNKISKVNTALNIALSHTRYYFDKEKGIEEEIESSLISM